MLLPRQPLFLLWPRYYDCGFLGSDLLICPVAYDHADSMDAGSVMISVPRGAIWGNVGQSLESPVHVEFDQIGIKP